MGPEKPYMVFSISWKMLTFGGRLTSLTLKLPYKNPKKIRQFLKRPGKPSWMAFF